MQRLVASIIIPTKDKISRLSLLLRILESQASSDIEAIVIFDGCNQKTIEAFKAQTFAMSIIPIICQENIGRAAARNMGLSRAKGDIVIFLDDDRMPSSNFILNHIESHKKPAVVIGPRFSLKLTEHEISDILEKGPTQGYETFEKRSYIDPKDDISQTGWNLLFRLDGPFRWMQFFTGNVSVPRRFLLDVGGFDENFRGWGHEDRDIGYRLSKKGLAFIRNDKAINYHIEHERNFMSQADQSITNMRYFIKKTRSDIRAVILLRMVLCGLIAKRALLGIKRKRFIAS